MARKRLNILFIASEAEPFIKVGGLGDVAGSLPQAIHDLSNDDTVYDIRLVLPFYGQIKKRFPEIKKLTDFNFHTGSLSLKGSVHLLTSERVPVYFIDGLPIKEDEPVYGSNFIADAEKFIFFSLACLELPRILKWKIDILHANDWHTAIAVHQLAKLKETRREFSRIKSVISLHNLAYMGAGSELALAKFGIEPAEDPFLPIWARTIPLPMGLASADRIVPVSPTYSREILTPDFGCGLENFFTQHLTRIEGILNGINNSLWDPSSDSLIPTRYNKLNLAGKKTCKNALKKEMGLSVNDQYPLITIISRMDQQKGIDLALESLSRLSNKNWHAIILGSGDPLLEKSALALESKMPGKVKTKILFDSSLSHRLYAGADIILMPSRYEPCGLSQLIAMRYGTIPVASATGGLSDTIKSDDPENMQTGFLFSPADAEQLTSCLNSALDTFQDSKKWQKIIKSAMSQDFSWSVSAGKYCDLYQRITIHNHQEEQ